MKLLKINFLSIIFIFFMFSKNVFAEDKVYATYTANNLTITSYSQSFTKPMLKDLYMELLNNFHGDELDYLKNIYIYPDNRAGVNGLYFDDIYIQDGQYKLGDNAYINLYNAQRLNSVDKIAYTLAHEYGHHYMVYNLLKKEGIYYHNLKDSKYVKIRNFGTQPVVYDTNKEEYLYHWDVVEIMADDYVQLLGSYKSKMSIQYKSVDDLVKEGKPLYDSIYSFNLKPQLNPFLPLAADVDGLYNYLISLGGFTVAKPKTPLKPSLKDITGYVNDNNQITYTLNIDNPNKTLSYEYTVVSYPDNNPFVPYPIKTFSSKSDDKIVFGSYALKTDKGVKFLTQLYEGKHTFKIYMKDQSGFIYASKPVTYDFDKINKEILSKDKAQKEALEKQKKAQIAKEQPSASPKVKFIGPSASGSLSDLFYINS